jgi:hypothetical protein
MMVSAVVALEPEVGLWAAADATKAKGVSATLAGTSKVLANRQSLRVIDSSWPLIHGQSSLHARVAGTHHAPHVLQSLHRR